MTTAVFNEKFQSKTLEFFRFSILAYALTDIITMVSWFVNIGYLQDAVVLLFNILFFISIFTFYKQYPEAFDSLKVIFATILVILFYFLSFIILVLYPFPKISNQISMDLTTGTDPFVNHIYLIILIFMLSSVVWIGFAYYFTALINKNFSGTLDKINLFFYASIFSAIAELVVVYSYYKIVLIIDDVKKSGITPANTEAFNSALSILVVSILLTLIYCVLEIQACWRIYKRITLLSKGQYVHKRRYNQNHSMNSPMIHTQQGVNHSATDLSYYCTYCGSKLVDSSNICKNCGKEVNYRP